MSDKSVQEHDYRTIMDDAPIRSWRQALLTGDGIPDSCQHCHWAPVATPRQLVGAVATAVVSARSPPAATPSTAELP